jgi:hypothetical protein
MTHQHVFSPRVERDKARQSAEDYQKSHTDAKQIDHIGADHMDDEK